ncbi:MAG: DUF892 family protein [Armatimonadota bacterium]
MPLEKHLVVHLQETLATERDYRDYLAGWSDQVSNAQLKSAVQHQINDIQQEMDVLRRCVGMLGATPKEEMKSPLVAAFRQDDQETMQEMPDATPADMDVHLCIADIKFGHSEIGAYQAMIDMAKAINRTDVVDLLQDNFRSEQRDVQQMQNLLPTLINFEKGQQAA